MPDACEHVLHLGSAFGNRFVASLLASTQRLVLVCFTLDAILKAQCLKQLLPALARIAFVSVDLPACVALVKNFVKVVAVMFAGCACRNATDEAVLVIDAHAELVAKVAFAMLFGVRGIQVLLPALGITPFGLLALILRYLFLKCHVRELNLRVNTNPSTKNEIFKHL